METKKLSYVNVTGNIGAGTTTLSTKLCDYFGWKASFSQAHTSPYLKDLYDRDGRTAFHNQAYIVVQSLGQHLKLDFKGRMVCQDYTLYEHNDVYSKFMRNRGYIDTREFEILRDLFGLFYPNIRKPDLLIFLRADTATLIERISRRNRQAERKIDRDYVEGLQKQFNSFAKSWKLCPILELDTTKVDFTRKKDFLKVAKELTTGFGLR